MDPRTFERRVAGAYRRLGADVQHDAILAGSQIDVLISEPTSSGTRVRRVVECKAFTTPVGVSVVRSFASLVDLLRSRGLVEGGVIVSMNGFSPQARQAAEGFQIELRELSDLEAQLRTASEAGVSALGEEVVLTSQSGPAPKRVFVVMPFTDELGDLYMLGIRETCEALGFVVERADEVQHNSSIMEVVLDHIRAADVVVGELSYPNPNVYYEVGFAHALERPVILCTRSGNEIPFDVAGINHLVYGSIVDFREKFRTRLAASLPN